MKKKRVLELVKMFGLIVDLDRWDEVGWLRVLRYNHKEYTEFKPKIIYKEKYDLHGEESLLDELQCYLMDIGVHRFKVALQEFITP